MALYCTVCGCDTIFSYVPSFPAALSQNPSDDEDTASRYCAHKRKLFVSESGLSRKRNTRATSHYIVRIVYRRRIDNNRVAASYLRSAAIIDVITFIVIIRCNNIFLTLTTRINLCIYFRIK